MILRLSEEVFKLSLYFYLQKPGAGKTTLTFTVSMNVLSAKFPFCVVPAGGEGGVNVDVSGKR